MAFFLHFIVALYNLNKEDAERLKDMHENYGVEDIYFQATPSAPKSSLKDVLKQFNL